VSSYRVTLIVGRLRPGATPEQVLPAAADAAAELARVEARDLEVVAGEARIVVRFLADDDAHARSVAGRVVGEVSGLATVPASVITRREGSRWVPVLTPIP
jgi:hypothetical protein